MNNAKRYTITSALPYANGPLHLGHLAGAYLSADAFARYLRLMGKDVAFICGSDEYGAAITIRAMKENTSPKEIVDKYHEEIKNAFEGMGISFDIYSRTTEEVHNETAQEFFKKLYDKGSFVEKESEQYYDPKAKMFLSDRYIKGTCPKCQNPNAYGDQCEKCGTTLSPTELIDPVSTLTNSNPILKSTRHWYLALNEHEEWIRNWIQEGKVDGKELHDPTMWKNHVTGQCLSWLDGGLTERSMTRDLTWGVDVPPAIPGSEGKKLYVWMDAPIGYISATKIWAEQNGKDWKPYWQDEETALYHFIGKDNIVFHCLIFPAILKEHGGYILPKNVPANQFLNLEGDKLSTSKNWAVWVSDYLADFKGQEDVLRYVLFKNMPEQRDSEFTWKGFQEANNNELVNNLANFANRVIVLTNKYYDGVVPAFDPDESFDMDAEGELPTWHDSAMIDLFDFLDRMFDHIRRFEFRAALKVLMEISSRGNQILQFNEPWKAIKEEPELVKVVLNICLQYLTAMSVAMQPFLPFTSAKLRELLQLKPLENNGELLELLNNLSEGLELIPAEHQLSKPSHLFGRIEDSVIDDQLEKLKANSATATSEASALASNPIKEMINFDDFMKMDLRTAEVLHAEKVPKTDKLLKLTLDLGGEERTVVSGISQHYSPEEIIGKKVVYLANLAPRKIRGVSSTGMILFAEDAEGKLGVVSPLADWPNGSSIK